MWLSRNHAAGAHGYNRRPGRVAAVFTIMRLKYRRISSLAAIALALSTRWAFSAGCSVNDEIQVYNAEIAKVGQWTLQLHSNYAISGCKEPEFEGGIIPNHALNGTPELAYGITPWWEIGFYAPYAVGENGTFYSNAGKIRQLFVSPDAAKREFFYGVNFEASYATPPFSQTRWNLEIRPIIGFRKNNYEFIVNPIVDVGFGQNSDAIFAPCWRFARSFGESFSLGIEYYTDLGPLQSLVPWNEQQHNIYAVVDFKVGRFDVNAGIGYGLTPGSDRVMAKMIIGTDLNDPDKSNDRPKLQRRPASLMGGFPTASTLSQALLPGSF
jgi:hypothetical protein